jgi:probable rRNA maturation factor
MRMKNLMAVEELSMPTTVDLDLQIMAEAAWLPAQHQFDEWAVAALTEIEAPVELVIRIVDAIESQALNKQFRNKAEPTNVLSFPFELPAELSTELKNNHLGDLVICAPVMYQEAFEQNKPEVAHWAHIVVHGLLHLQGYDHQNESDATTMESKEIKIMNRLGYPDPYV